MYVGCARVYLLYVGSQRKYVHKFALVVNYILYKWSKTESLCSAASNQAREEKNK